MRVGEKDSVASSGQRITFKQRLKCRGGASHCRGPWKSLLDCGDSRSGCPEVRINMDQCVCGLRSQEEGLGDESRDRQRSGRKGACQPCRGIDSDCSGKPVWISAGDLVIRLTCLKDHLGFCAGIVQGRQEWTQEAQSGGDGRWWLGQCGFSKNKWWTWN